MNTRFSSFCRINSFTTDIWSNWAIVSRSDAILEKSLRRKKKNATMWWFWCCGYPSPLFSMHGHGIYLDSMLLVPVVSLSELVYGPYTQFLTRPARKESNVQKLKSFYELTVLMYILWCTALFEGKRRLVLNMRAIWSNLP